MHVSVCAVGMLCLLPTVGCESCRRVRFDFLEIVEDALAVSLPEIGVGYSVLCTCCYVAALVPVGGALCTSCDAVARHVVGMPVLSVTVDDGGSGVGADGVTGSNVLVSLLEFVAVVVCRLAVSACRLVFWCVRVRVSVRGLATP